MADKDKGYGWNRSLGGLYAQLKHADVRRKVKTTLTRAEFAHLRRLPCRYCGGKLPEAGYGIDRLDSNKGYTTENSVPCCARCNSFKNNLPELAFKSHIEAIYKYFVAKP